MPEFDEYWSVFFWDSVNLWFKYHDYWMEKIKNQEIPIFIFRFEDLLVTPEKVLKDMFRFILAKKDIDGCIIEQRIRDVISGGKNFLYKPRAAGGGFHKHMEKLTAE